MKPNDISIDWKGFRTAIVLMGVGFAFLNVAVPYTTPRIVALARVFRTPHARTMLEAATNVAIATSSAATSTVVLNYSSTTPWSVVSTLTPGEVIPGHGPFVTIDVPDMLVFTYQNGQQTNMYPIISVATSSINTVPQGFYSALDLQKKDVSRVNGGYLSFSVGLSASCSIHGDPRNADMTIAKSDSQSGCVRLSEKDASAVFAFAATNTPIFVYRPISHASSSSIILAKSTATSTIAADAYLVADLDTGEVYRSHNATSTYPIASLTKLITTLTVMKEAPLASHMSIDPAIFFNEERLHTRTSTSTITIHTDPISSAQAYIKALDNALPADVLSNTGDISTSTLIQLTQLPDDNATTTTKTVIIRRPATVVHHTNANDSFAIGDLLTGMILQSNNDIANALAAHVGTGPFVSSMNSIAHSIGMASTTIADPSGVSASDASNAHDLFTLIRYIAQAFPSVLDLTHTGGATLTADSHTTYEIHNVNHPADQAGFLGGKVGETSEALQTSIMIASVPVGGVPHRIAIIILHSTDQSGDVDSLVQWFQQSASIAKATSTVVKK